jgi:hypothetical protein
MTIAARELADGPTVLRLGPDAPRDLRRLFRPGERFLRRPGAASTRNVALCLAGVPVWRPAPLPPVSNERLAANLRLGTAELERHRQTRSSVIDREAADVLGALQAACRSLDLSSATTEIHCLLGWGEGLTPAGDDALVGLLAALGALAAGDAARLPFLRSLSAVIVSRASRTTVISAHYLRLAAQGHFNADVTDLIHAFLAADESGDGDVMRDALESALDVGATSGADTVAGMIAGLRAWAPSDA